MNSKQYLFLPLSIVVYLIGSLFQINFVLAQVISDGTTGTTVDGDGNNFEINDGIRNGSNLFHSFQDFSVPNGGSASFNNAVDVDNILSRVTGGNISNIDGLIRANGSANLFLINPAGIIFGNNARLDVGGSFYGSTADSILFEDGEFSAVNNLDAPILTINAPIGLNLRDNSSPIINRSFAENSAGEFVGLEILSGNTIGLVGGNINFEAGEITASGGQIELGGLADAGTVTIESDGSLTFPESIAKANLSFTDAADLDVRGSGGSISVNANNLEISGGEEFGNSIFRAGITADSTSVDAQAGDINLNAKSLSITDGSQIQNSVFGGNEESSGGKGNAGNVIISVEEDVLIAGSDQDGFSSAIFTDVESGAEGNAGNIIISANSFSLNEGAFLNSSTSGQGNAGNIEINAASSTINNANLSSSTSGQGNAGNINIIFNNLELVDGSIGSTVQSSAVGVGGEIALTGQSISLSEGSIITTATLTDNEQARAEQVQAGNIELNVSQSLTLSRGSALTALTGGVGDAGNIRINGEGADIIVEDNISEGNENNIFSGAISSLTDSSGDAGDILITAKSLSLRDAGSIDSNTVGGAGNAGNIRIEIAEDITLINSLIGSASIASENDNNVGNAGSINIISSSLILRNDTGILAIASGQGNGGNLTFNISDRLTLDGNSTITAQASGTDASGGSIFINAENGFLIAFPRQNQGNGNDIFAFSSAGTGGNITIEAQGVFGIEERNSISGNNTNDIDASGELDNGNVEIITPNTDAIEGSTELSTTPIEPGETIAQACSGQHRASADNSNLVVRGKGGIPPSPFDTLNSEIITIGQYTETDPATEEIETISTSAGEIIPAQGVEIEDGEIILTAYKTDNSSRDFQKSANCNQSSL